MPISLDQPHHPLPLPGPRRQQLQHLVVGAAGPAGEQVHHHVRQVVVADAHRVGVAERALRGLGGGPDPDAGHQLQPGHRVAAGVMLDALLEPAGDRGGGPDGALPLQVDAEAVPVPGRARPAAPAGGGGTRRPSTGPGAGVPNRRSSSRHDRRASAPVTFCSRTAGHERVQHQPGARQPQPGLAPAGLVQQPDRRDVEPRPVVAARPAGSAPGRATSRHPRPTPGRVTTAPAACRQACPARPASRRPPRTARSRRSRWAGSPVPRTSGHSVARTSTGRPASQHPLVVMRSNSGVRRSSHASDENRTAPSASWTPGHTRAPSRSSTRRRASRRRRSPRPRPRCRRR